MHYSWEPILYIKMVVSICNLKIRIKGEKKSKGGNIKDIEHLHTYRFLTKQREVSDYNL